MLLQPQGRGCISFTQRRLAIGLTSCLGSFGKAATHRRRGPQTGSSSASKYTRFGTLWRERHALCAHPCSAVRRFPLSTPPPLFFTLSGLPHWFCKALRSWCNRWCLHLDRGVKLQQLFLSQFRRHNHRNRVLANQRTMQPKELKKVAGWLNATRAGNACAGWRLVIRSKFSNKGFFQ